MDTETVLPLREARGASQGRRLLTRQDCEVLEGAGLLPGRYELVEGDLYTKMGEKPPHRVCVRLVAAWLISLFGPLRVQSEDPIELPAEEQRHNAPEPDVAVTREPTTAYADRHPGPEDLLLVVEVSDTTLDLDRTVKAALYARAGIAENWVLDVTGRELHVHREPSGAGYGDVAAYGAESIVAPLAAPEHTAWVRDLLPALEEQTP